MEQASSDKSAGAPSESGSSSVSRPTDASPVSTTREPAALPGLGLVLALLAAGIVWSAVGAAQRVHVADPTVAAHAALPDGRLDVNIASEPELTLLPGIGPRLAERIVLDREAHGPFETLSDLTRVTWIGPVIVQRIEPYAFAGDGAPR